MLITDWHEMKALIHELVEVLLYVRRNRRFIRDGEPRTATTTFTQLLSSDTSCFSHGSI